MTWPKCVHSIWAANLRSKKAKTAEGDDISNRENVSLDNHTPEAGIDIEGLGDGLSPTHTVHCDLASPNSL